MEPGSLRIATRGESRVARNPGKKEAAAAMPATSTAASAKGGQSRRCTCAPRTSSQPTPMDAAPPIASP